MESKVQLTLCLTVILFIATLLYSINNIQSYAMDACELYAEIRISQLYHNGSIRQNPDGTYYAGDAFAYTIYHGYNDAVDGSCMDYSYWLEVDDAIMHGSSTSGIIEIRTDAGIGTHAIRFQQRITHMICAAVGEDSVCFKFMYVKSTSYTYRVVDPLFQAYLSKNQLIDGDGFIAMNKDKTYYIGDPVAILHKTNYRFKNERIGTLHVVVEREYDDIMPVYEYNCLRELCKDNLRYDEYTSTLDITYGDGITLYDTNDSLHGIHKVRYAIKLMNIDKVIATINSSIDINLVRYMPVYHYYVYLVLDDDKPWSYNKSIAIALHYHGSMDDNGAIIHPLRRSKINHYEYNINTINAEVREDPKIVHVEAHDFNAEKNALIFYEEGYGKIVFAPLVENDSRLHFTLRLGIRLYSYNFAGHDILEVIDAEYVYPLVKFSTSLDITVYDSDGDIKDVPVKVEMQPLGNYLHDYIMNKVLHDSAHGRFAEMVIEDMYARDNYAKGSGHLSMRINYTSYHIPEYVLARYNLYDIPLHIALDTLTPYRIRITVGDVTRIYDEYTFSFYRNYVIIVNMDLDNKIEDISLVNDRIIFRVDEKFGDVTMIVVDGIVYEPKKYCSEACIIPFYNESARVEVYNEWGGRAYAEVTREKGDKLNNASDMSGYVWTTMLVSVFILILFTAYRIIVNKRA